MGIGVTGYMQATDEQRSWLSDCYKFLRSFDEHYSIAHGFRKSIKLCTVKPAGTLSLLAGVTSGVHPGFAQQYIRRIRISSESPLIQLAKKHGYSVEYARKFDGTNDHSTQIISFPYQLPKGTILAENCTAIDQLEWMKKLQTDWSDNSVSITVYYRKEELPAIKDWLKANYNTGVKTVSFLLHSGHGFDQAPLEAITQEQYDEMVQKCKPITSTEGVCFVNESEELLAQNECVGNSCPLR
jgi:ribonucleoside-diphosphate reductase alpha chain